MSLPEPEGRRGGPPSDGRIGAINLVVLKVVSPCNLDCTYCYVYHGKDSTYRSRPPLLAEQLAEAMLSRLNAYCAKRPGHRISICLHGGEPLLLGKDRFHKLVDLIRSRLGPHLGELSVQTNAVLLDRGWARLLQELKVSVSVSLDGTPAANDSARVDHKGRGAYARTIAGIRNLAREGIPVSVLCVVRPGTSGAEAYTHLRSLGLTQLDFLLPDVSHDDWRERFGEAGPTPAADYLIPALDAWLAEDDPNVEVRFFSDMFKLVLGDSASTDAFGGGPMPYVVIETDGAIQANDALRVCEEALGDTGLNVLTHDLDDLQSSRPLARDLIAGAVPQPGACRACPELSTCGGGYMPHRYSRDRGFDNPSVWCADILKVFGHMRDIVEAWQPTVEREVAP